jgi:hypothetical protein
LGPNHYTISDPTLLTFSTDLSNLYGYKSGNLQPQTTSNSNSAIVRNYGQLQKRIGPNPGPFFFVAKKWPAIGGFHESGPSAVSHFSVAIRTLAAVLMAEAGRDLTLTRREKSGKEQVA